MDRVAEEIRDVRSIAWIDHALRDLYEISPLDSASFTMAGAILVATSAVAAVLPAAGQSASIRYSRCGVSN
jgi:hypothetical protein